MAVNPTLTQIKFQRLKIHSAREGQCLALSEPGAVLFSSPGLPFAEGTRVLAKPAEPVAPVQEGAWWPSTGPAPKRGPLRG